MKSNDPIWKETIERVEHIEKKKICCIVRMLYYDMWKFNIPIISDYDTVFLICLDKHKKIMERLYKIPVKHIDVRCITIIRSYSKWEKFRVDEKPYIDTYNNIKMETKNKIDPRYRVGHSEFLKESERLGLTGYQYHQKLINEKILVDPLEIARMHNDKLAQAKGYKNHSAQAREIYHNRMFYEEKPPGDIANDRAQEKGFKNHTKYQESLVQKKGYIDYNEYRRIYHHEKGTYFPMSDNENCPAHLGVHIAERRDARKILPVILGKIIKEMPYGNPGFDFLIDGDIKVDVKSRSLTNNRYPFMIRHNGIADYFLCIGYEEDKDNNPIPVHIWLFWKDDMIRKQTIGNNYIVDKFHKRDVLGISNIPSILDKFAKYDKIDIFKQIDGDTL